MGKRTLDFDAQAVRERILQESKHLGLTDKEFEKWLLNKAGLMSQQKTNYFTGTNLEDISLEVIIKIAKAMQRPPDYFIYGKEWFYDKYTEENLKLPLLDPYLSDENFLVDRESEECCIFKMSKLRDLSDNPLALRMMVKTGDHMESKISKGDRVIVDTSKQKITDGAVHAFYFNGTKNIQIRQLDFHEDRINIFCENRKYPSVLADPKRIAIVGEIVYVCRCMTCK